MGILDLWNKPENNIKESIKQAIENKKSLAIKYRKFDGTVSSREIRNVVFNNSFEVDGFHNDHIKGFCSIRNEERTFKIDRIISAEIVK
jgi:predicted DNA-binding transcriptional regulator YafY